MTAPGSSTEPGFPARSPAPPAGAEPGRDPSTPRWRPDPPLRHEVPEGAEYGYLLGNGPHPTTRDELVEWVRTYPSTPGVWTPESGGATRPEEVQFLVEALRTRRVEEAQQHLGMASLGCIALAGAYFLLGLSPDTVGPGSMLAAVLVGFWLLDSLYNLFRARRVDGRDFALQRQNERHAVWAFDRPAPFTRVLAGALAGVFVTQVLVQDRSIAAAGLVKEAARAGEWWRLLTGPMLHGDILHLGMNLAALGGLGRFVEVHASRFRMAQVFLAAVLAGSAFSLLITPHASVGASGGIMGLVGYLGVRARLRPEEFPDDFLHQIRYAIGATAVLGVLGFALVDNWAHLGGLLAGGAVAWILDRRPGGGEGRRSRPAGYAALGVLLLACAWAAALVLGIVQVVPATP
ncbi:MAG TPA: rhomboid family intramembrane serine protease [Longimicrobiaceae bacterium]